MLSKSLVTCPFIFYRIHPKELDFFFITPGSIIFHVMEQFGQCFNSGKGKEKAGPTHRRARTMSTFSIASNSSLVGKLWLDVSKAAPANLGSPPLFPSNASGSFSPTASASASLRSFAQCSSSRERTVSLHARPPTRRAVPMWINDTAASPPDSVISSSPQSIQSSIHSIPSISRTASSFTGVDDASTAPTSVHVSRDSSPKPSLHSPRAQPARLHPVLAACERGSKFTTQMICATCAKPGRNYPKCAKCGEMWCSRACRLKDGAKRHVCAS